MPHLTLRQDSYESGIRTHNDIIVQTPTVLSDKRANKVGAIHQVPYADPKGPGRCIICHPENLEGQPEITYYCDGRVGMFPNAAPFLPYDHSVYFVRHPDPDITMNGLHVWQMHQLRAFELSEFLRGAVERGQEFAKQGLNATNLIRYMLFFNIGNLAGQSLPHIHAQSGWEVSLDSVDFSPNVLKVYFEELKAENLIMFSSDEVDYEIDFKLVAPWTPRGQYAVDLYFTDKYEIHNLEDKEIRLFGYFANKILQGYQKLGICNTNIVFSSSPRNCRIVPVIAHFIPRVNLGASYEQQGRNVVDTPPQAIFNEMKKIVTKWPTELRQFEKFDPIEEYKTSVGDAPADPYVQVRTHTKDGERVPPGTHDAEISFELRQIPMAQFDAIGRTATVDIELLEQTATE